MNRYFQTFPVLVTERLTLRKLSKNDTAALVASLPKSQEENDNLKEKYIECLINTF